MADSDEDIFAEKQAAPAPVPPQDDLDYIFGEKKEAAPTEPADPVLEPVEPAPESVSVIPGAPDEATPELESEPVEAAPELVPEPVAAASESDLAALGPVENTPVSAEPAPTAQDDTDDDLFQDVISTPEKTPAASAEVDIFGDKDEEDDKLFDEEISLSDGNEKAPPALAVLSDGAAVLDDIVTTAEKEEEEGGDSFDINIKLSDPIKVGDGMSAYMAYSVTTQTSIPSFKRSQFSVKRRFSDFLGLHERLSEKHASSGRIIPPPPDKSVVGMVKVKGSKDDQSSTEFVAKRKHALEKYLNRIARHKVLVEDSDFREFLEAEELPRAKNTSALSMGGLSRFAKGFGDAVSKMTTKMPESDSWYEDKQSRVDELDIQVRKLASAADVLLSLRREVATNTASFSKSVSLLSGSEEHPGLSRALTQLAELEEKVEQIQNKQVETDFFLLSETLKEYIGLIASVKAAFAQRVKVWGNWQSAQSTLAKKRETLVKLELSNKPDKVVAAKEEVTEWERRVEKGEEEFETISKDIKDEVAGFETMRVKDFKELIVGYLESLLGIEQQLMKLWEGFGPVAKSIC